MLDATGSGESLFDMARSALPPPPTATHGENSEVLPKESVAVAVMNEAPGGKVGMETLKVAAHVMLVDTVVEPMKSAPSPLLDGSHALLAKNSIV